MRSRRLHASPSKVSPPSSIWSITLHWSTIRWDEAYTTTPWLGDHQLVGQKALQSSGSTPVLLGLEASREVQNAEA